MVSTQEVSPDKFTFSGVLPVTASEKVSSLKRMRFFALLLLLTVTLGFILSSLWIGDYPWLVWVQSFCEAAMIGALADWFAVTALFRHPLGLPIPHTAIIPNKKAQIGVEIGAFIQKNYLSLRVINQKIDAVNPALKVAAWLGDDDNAKNAAHRLAVSTGGFLEALADADLNGILQNGVEDLLHSTRAAPFLGNCLAVLWESDSNHQIPELGFKLAEVVLRGREEELTKALRGELPWYIPAFMRRKIFAKMIGRLRLSVGEVMSEPKHPFREALDSTIERLISDLRYSEEYLQKGEQIKKELISNQAIKDYLAQLSTGLKDRLKVVFFSDQQQTALFLQQVIIALSNQVIQSPELQEKFNLWLKALARDFIRNNSSSLISFIAETTNSWDTKTVVDKIELQVGRDLQFIRINGTLVGGLIGLVLQIFLIALD